MSVRFRVILAVKLLKDPMVPKLVRIESPFSDWSFPEIRLFPGDEFHSQQKALVAGGPVDCRKFLVDFKGVAAARWTNESLDCGQLLSGATPPAERACYCLLENSPWLKMFQEFDSVVESIFGSTKLKHFVLFGADIVTEIIASEEPQIKEVRLGEKLFEYAA